MRIYVDVDETICTSPPDRDYSKAVPIPKNIAMVNELYDEGHEITYWTARGSCTGTDWEDITTSQLNRWGCKRQGLKMGKPAYDVFIDDKVLNTVVWEKKGNDAARRIYLQNNEYFTPGLVPGHLEDSLSLSELNMSPYEEMKEKMRASEKSTSHPVSGKTRSSMSLPNDINSVVLVREFRWTLNGPNLPEYWMQSVKIDWMKKELHCRVHEAWLSPGKVDIIRWLEDFEKYADEPLTFTTWSGCGSALYEYTFRTLGLLSHSSGFDYSSSGISDRFFTLSFESYDHQIFEHTPEEPVNSDMPCKVMDGFEVESTKFNFLNDTLHLPGRAIRTLKKLLGRDPKCTFNKDGDVEITPGSTKE